MFSSAPHGQNDDGIDYVKFSRISIHSLTIL